MEFMSLGLAVRYGTPVLIFVLVVLNVWLVTMMRQMQTQMAEIKDDVKETKDDIVWRDVYELKSAEIDRRLAALESRG
jgi:uncharacterized membrane protein YgaE (UPF0421/DUF939 family)